MSQPTPVLVPAFFCLTLFAVACAGTERNSHRAVENVRVNGNERADAPRTILVREPGIPAEPGGLLVPFSARRPTNSVGHGDQHSQLHAAQPGPDDSVSEMAATDVATSTARSTTECSAPAFAALPTEAVAGFLESHDLTCLRDWLWTYDSDVALAMREDNLTAIANAATAASRTYNGTNDSGLHQLFYFLHAAAYHEFYTPLEIGPNASEAIRDAVLEFSGSPHWNDKTDTARAILYEWVVTVDGTNNAPSVMFVLSEYLESLETDPAEALHFDTRYVTYGVLYLIQRAAGRVSEFDREVSPDLIDLVRRVAQSNIYLGGNEYIINNAIWSLGHLTLISDKRVLAVNALASLVDRYEPLSEPHLWLLTTFTRFTSCASVIPGRNMCKQEVARELEARLFPSKVIYDDGAIVIHTALPQETTDHLYNAAKEVEAQFNRVTTSIRPVPGDPNATLKIRLYATRSDYEKFHPFLYDLDTNNGGIYIEQTGTFYTYQRTSSESIYTLEELFRHEYSHYLAGRYLVPGMWGEEAIYANNRMTWIDEGFAEFLAGSTRGQGVLVRAALVRQVAGDVERMTVRQVVRASYGSFVFYRYAGLFFNYLYANDQNSLKELFFHAHEGEASKLDAYLNRVATSEELDSKYQQFLDASVASVSSLTTPSTALHDASADSSDIAAVQEGFRSSNVGHYATCNESAQASLRRFTCKGQLSGTLNPTRDWAFAWHELDRGLDRLLGELEHTEAPTNFRATTCRFANVRFATYGLSAYPLADYFCDGPLAAAPATEEVEPLVRVRADFAATRLGQNAVCAYAIRNGVATRGVDCKLDLTTQLVNASVSDATLNEELTRDLQELENNVYASNRTFYQAFDCDFTAEAQTIPYGPDDRYLLRSVLCALPGVITDPLERTKADFTSTRLGAHARCAYSSSTEIACDTTLTTVAHPNDTDDSVLAHEIERDMQEIETSVSSKAPDFYASLLCAPSAAAWNGDAGPMQKYRLQDVRCRLQLDHP